MKKTKTTTIQCKFVTGPSTRLRCGYFGAAAALLLLMTAGAAWGQPSEVTKVLASDAACKDIFGVACSIAGDTAIVGAVHNDDDGSNSGSAYIFQQHVGGPDNWGEVRKLIANDAFAGDSFGGQVSISGDFVIVGAPHDDDAGSNSGSAYIFYRDEGGLDIWGQVAKLTASDGAANDSFGWSVSISGDTAIAGSFLDDDDGNWSGSVYVFVRPPGGWVDMTQTAKLTAPDAGAGDSLGFSVSISGDTILAGAIGDADNGSHSGSAYVFVKPPGGWVDMNQAAKLTVSDGAPFDRFGNSVAISGDVAVVAAWTDDDSGDESGSAYVFVKPSGGWADMTETGNLTASDGAAGDEFGSDVSIRGDTVIIGAWFDDDNGSDSGSAYVFQRPLEGWIDMTETYKLTASDGAAGDFFGRSVSISGDLAIVGADWDDDASPGNPNCDSGSAYIMDGVCPCPWDLDGDGVVGVKDLLILLGAWGPCGDCADCPADLDGDCYVGVKDLLLLLGTWGNCPCAEGTPPLSLEEELDDVCLTMDDWDEFEAVMDDPSASQEDKDNYLCWMSHYLEGCSRCSCTGALCPGPDPFS